MYYRDSIVQAEKEILIAAGFWRPGKVVNIITAALRELNNIISVKGGPKVVVKIVRVIYSSLFIHYSSIF